MTKRKLFTRIRNANINVLAIVKEATDEKYIFLFDDEHSADCLRTLGRFATNQELSFTWYDAAILSRRVRELCEVSQ